MVGDLGDFELVRQVDLYEASMRLDGVWCVLVSTGLDGALIIFCFIFHLFPHEHTEGRGSAFDAVQGGTLFQWSIYTSSWLT